MAFSDPIVGTEVLIRNQIQSENFSSDPELGVTGWQIKRDGTATFNNITVGSANYTIDADGNAVFLSVSAGSIDLDGDDLATALDALPRGVIGVTTNTSNSADYSGTEIRWNEIVIPSFDATRQYRVGGIARFDKGSATPTYIRVICYFNWGSPADSGDSVLFEVQDGGMGTSATDWALSFEHVFKNGSPPATDLYLAFYFDASGTSAVNYQGTSYGRVWVEDIGISVSYNEFESGGGGGTPQQFVKTYSATGSSSFQSDGDNRGVSECYQGYYSGTNGNQFSLIAFDYSQIQSDTAGATIDKVELYLNNNHFYFNSGGDALIGTHNETSVSGDHPVSDVLDDRISTPAFSKGQAKWVTIPNSIGENLRDGTRKGIALGPASSNSNADYGYFAGNGQSGEPQLRITYTKEV